MCLCQTAAVSTAKKQRPTERERLALQQISDAKEAAGLSQQQLADAAGISQSQVSKVLRGERAVTLMEFVALVDAVGLDVGEVARTSLRRATKAERVTPREATSAPSPQLPRAEGMDLPGQA